MRNQDNYTNSKQYIIEQLFPYNYNDEEDKEILKKKLWVLDGPVRKEEYIDEETPDKDVDNPMDHWNTLLNDLTYLDKYIRTEQDELEEREKSFDEFWDQRIQGKERFINREKDEETGETYEDWEQPYNQRPTLLEKEDFSELYQQFIIKQDNNELEKAKDIVKSITDYCVDIESKQAEQQVEADIPPEQMEEDLKVKAGEEQNKNDYNYVLQMKDIHDEMWNIISSLIPDTDEEEWDAENDYQEGDRVLYEGKIYQALNQIDGDPVNPPPPDDEENWSLMEEVQIVAVNLPTKRDQIVLEKNHSTHRGMIIEQLNEGGYRFVYRDEDQNSIDIPIGLNEMDTFENNVSPDNTGDLEDSWEDVIWAEYYNITDKETEETTGYMNPLSDVSDLPSGDNEPDSISIERFSELNNRWKNINKLREYQISNMGTRAIIESMVNAEIPDLSDDKVEHFNTKKNQKQFYTDILREKTEEFI